MPQLVFSGQTGCLLPLLIILNFLFGRPIFNSTYIWLGVEVVLILIFLVKIHIFAKNITKQFYNQDSHGRVVDVEGKVVEENKKLE